MTGRTVAKICTVGKKAMEILLVLTGQRQPHPLKRADAGGSQESMNTLAFLSQFTTITDK